MEEDDVLLPFLLLVKYMRCGANISEAGTQSTSYGYCSAASCVACLVNIFSKLLKAQYVIFFTDSIVAFLNIQRNFYLSKHFA